MGVPFVVPVFVTMSEAMMTPASLGWRAAVLVAVTDEECPEIGTGELLRRCGAAGFDSFLDLKMHGRPGGAEELSRLVFPAGLLDEIWQPSRACLICWSRCV